MRSQTIECSHEAKLIQLKVEIDKPTIIIRALISHLQQLIETQQKYRRTEQYHKPTGSDQCL